MWPASYICHLLATLDVALCEYDADDRAVCWNQTFLDFFPEQADHIRVGESYADNLRRFYRQRLAPDEMPDIERYVAEGVIRHRTQLAPFQFTHRGRHLRVSSLPSPSGSRVRIWREVAERADAAEHSIPAFDMLGRIPEGACIADDLGHVLAANDAFRRLYDIPGHRVITGLALDEIVAAAWRDGPVGALRAKIRAGLSYEGAPFEIELPNDRWRRVVTRHEQPGVVYQVHSDISAQKRQTAEMRLKAELSAGEARTDSLTGLANRRAFDEMVAKEAAARGCVTLIATDIDHFKIFNDTLGHAAGDECIRQVGNILHEIATRGGATAARIGGDEFAILVPSNAPVTPQELAEQCAARIKQSQIGDGGIRLSVSMGVGEGPTAELARQCADQALYAAKRQGRDAIVSWPERAV